MFTQCPSCQTIFEISTEHLKAAGGDVRCGQCLDIFNALEHLSEELPTHKHSSNSNHIEAEAEYQDLPDDPFEAETHANETAQSAIIEDAVEEPATFADSTTDATTKVSPEAPAEKTIAATPETKRDTSPSEQHDGQDVEQPAEMPDDASAETINLAELANAKLTEEDGDLVEFFGEVVDDSETMIPNTMATKTSPKTSAGGFYYGANEATIEKILREEDADLSEYTLNPDDKSSRPKKRIEKPVIDESSGREVQTINLPSLIMEDLEAEKAARLKPPNTRWIVGNILLMMVFILQAVYFSRDNLAKNPAWRPMITQACEMLGCDIAVSYDIKLIEILGRDVRSHPTANKALIAGTTIINNAKYSQPYPLLTLTFSDIRGTKLAQRRFMPQEYLRSGADIKAGMKPEVPIQVELELVDPGKDAVNFEFHAEADPRFTHPRT